jgi:DNA-binding MarR family transcriptional regulator
MQDRYDLHSGLGYQLAIAARTNNAGFDESLSALGLTRQTWCVLVAVGEQQITTPSAIADYIGIIRPAASRTLKQMDENGLLKRSAGDIDKRSTTVALTERGIDLLRKSMPVALKTREHIDAALSPTEQSQLSNLLAKLTASMASKATGV